MDNLVYLDGQLVHESDAKVSIFDIGFMYSAVFMEALRTFHHELFRLEEHLERLERSIKSVGLGAMVSREHIGEAIQRVLTANLPSFGKDDDCWVCVQVTPGKGFPQPLVKGDSGKPTVMAYVSPLPYDEYADCYLRGKDGVVATVRNVPPSVVDPRAKTRFRLHYFAAKLEVATRDPHAFALLLDTEGYVTEGTGANLFVASKDVLYTPTTRNILEGISRRTVIELAIELNIKVVERDLTLFDIFNADEGFWTTSSYCMLPLRKVNNLKIGVQVPGPITTRILSAWSRKVGLDIVAQAMKYKGRKSNVWKSPERIEGASNASPEAQES